MRLGWLRQWDEGGKSRRHPHHSICSWLWFQGSQGILIPIIRGRDGRQRLVGESSDLRVANDVLSQQPQRLQELGEGQRWYRLAVRRCAPGAAGGLMLLPAEADWGGRASAAAPCPRCAGRAR